MNDIKTGQLIGEKISNSQYLGKPLYKRTFSHTTDWGVISVDGKNYANGWYFIEEGKEIEGYGKSNENWLINYDTGEVIKLEKDKFDFLSAQTTQEQVAQDDLIFDLDAKIIDMAKNDDGTVTEESLQNVLDENSKLVNFDWNGTTSGVTKSSIMFDGENDYIKIKYDNPDEKEILKNNGFTVEIYGKLQGGNIYDENDSLYSNDWRRYGMALFSLGNDDTDKKNFNTPFRFFCSLENVSWSATKDYGENIDYNLSDFSADNIRNQGTQTISIGETLLENEPYYFTFTLDCNDVENRENGDFYKFRYYLNGNPKVSGGYNKLSWEIFKEKLDNLFYFYVAKTNGGDIGRQYYLKGDMFAFRLYNRALREEEVKKSYEDTFKYHKMLENE